MPMRKFFIAAIALSLAALVCPAQSGRSGKFSEGSSRITVRKGAETSAPVSGDEIKVETDLVVVPVRITSRDQRPVTDLRQADFRIFENGEQQTISYFSATDQPFTVALMLDMSYSTVFKLEEIQAAALLFISKLRETDRVMVVAFDQRPVVLCRPTNDRKALRLAIESTRVGSGTSLYDALDMTIGRELAAVSGRKAVVLLSDGVDTMSSLSSAKKVLGLVQEEDALFYALSYNTFDDVRKNRRKDAQIRYDDDDRPYVYEEPPKKGEREADYVEAREFLDSAADISGGTVFRVSDRTNLNSSFERIADELRKTYSLGYYPNTERVPGAQYTLKIRIYRPNLLIRTH